MAVLLVRNFAVFPILIDTLLITCNFRKFFFLCRYEFIQPYGLTFLQRGSIDTRNNYLLYFGKEHMVNMLKVAFRHVHRAIFLGGKAASMPCCSTDRSLEEDYLVPLLIESFTRNIDGSLRQVSRDIRKAERRNGRYRLICGEENRKNTMPQRINSSL